MTKTLIHTSAARPVKKNNRRRKKYIQMKRKKDEKIKERDKNKTMQYIDNCGMVTVLKK